jgi:DNA-directed RNA polymerase subunit L
MSKKVNNIEEFRNPISKYNFNKDKQSLTVEFSTQDTSIPSAIRRILVGYIPTYSIDINSINISENNTIFHNERICHILTLIPINNEKKNTDYDKLNFSLIGIFDKNKIHKDDTSFNERVIIYSDDIKSSDGESYFLPGVPIIEIRKGEKIIISEMKLKKDISNNHCQFQSCIVKYNILSNTTNNVKTKLEITPVGINIFKENDIYPFSPKKVFNLSLNILIEKCKNLKNNINNLEINMVPIRDTYIVNINIPDEEHTIGYLLQSTISNMDEFKNKEFVGYRNPHPLKKYIIIKMITKEPKKIIEKALSNIINILSKINKI